MEFKQDKFSTYVLSLDLDDEITVCIRAENGIQIQDKYSKVFVFKQNNLKVLPLQENYLEIWAFSGDKSVELEVKFPDFPFYMPASRSTELRESENQVLFSASKMSLLKDFITGLFKARSQDYYWVSSLDGNGISIDFADQVVVSADDPVVLSRFLKRLLDWAQIPIIVSSVQLNKESFRRSLRFWVEELIKKRETSPIQIELLGIKNDEGGDIDYFDQEFLDELTEISQGEQSIFSRGFLEDKIGQVVQEYFRSRGASQQSIDKTNQLVKQVKNPDVELIDTIVFHTTGVDFS